MKQKQNQYEDGLATPEHVKQTLEFMEEIQKEFEKEFDCRLYIEPDELSDLNIQWHTDRPLRFSRDEPENEPDTFIHPIPANVVDTKLRIYWPEVYKLDGAELQCRWREAYELYTALWNCLSQPQDDILPKDGLPPCLKDNYQWKRMRLSPYTKRINLLETSPNVMIWWIGNIWVRDDPSQPHLIAYLCHIDGIRDDALNVREMKTVYDLIRFQYQEEKYKQHRIIPITLISGSGFQLRIVQAYVDGAQNVTNVRTSPIIDFFHETDMIQPHWKEFCTVLGWILGDPVGNTY